MANYQMGRPGSMFVDGEINIAWGANREESDVQSVPKDMQTPRFQQRVLAGVIVETKRPATNASPLDIGSRRLMTGEEARAHKAEPAGPVLRRVWDAGTRDTKLVEMARPQDLSAALEAAERIDAEATGNGDVESLSGDDSADDSGASESTEISTEDTASVGDILFESTAGEGGGEDQGTASNPAVSEHPGALAAEEPAPAPKKPAPRKPAAKRTTRRSTRK